MRPRRQLEAILAQFPRPTCPVSRCAVRCHGTAGHPPPHYAEIITRDGLTRQTWTIPTPAQEGKEP